MFTWHRACLGPLRPSPWGHRECRRPALGPVPGRTGPQVHRSVGPTSNRPDPPRESGVPDRHVTGLGDWCQAPLGTPLTCDVLRPLVRGAGVRQTRPSGPLLTRAVPGRPRDVPPFPTTLGRRFVTRPFRRLRETGTGVVTVEDPLPGPRPAPEGP